MKHASASYKMCFGHRFYTPIKLQKKCALHTKNVPRSTLLHTYKTTKKCIQFLNEHYIFVYRYPVYDCLWTKLHIYMFLLHSGEWSFIKSAEELLLNSLDKNNILFTSTCYIYLTFLIERSKNCWIRKVLTFHWLIKVFLFSGGRWGAFLTIL
jgi:hypothetical protein